MNEEDARVHFMMQSGQRESDRAVQNCLDGLSLLLHNQHVQVNGKGYLVKVVGNNGKIMLDIRDLPGFDHIEFTIEKTGWERNA